MQQPHFTVTDTPQDIAAAYPAGTYLAQMQEISEGSAGVRYATAAAAQLA